MDDSITEAAAKGVTTLFGISPIVTILVLIIIAQFFALRWLAVSYRDLITKQTDVIGTNNTMLGTWAEIIRNAVNK